MHEPGEVIHPQFLELRARIAEGLAAAPEVGWGPYPNGLHLWEPRSQSHYLSYFFPDLEEPPFGKTGEVELLF